MHIELNDEDARRSGVADAEMVRVFNDYGSISAVCRVSERVRPGVAWMPFGGLTDAQEFTGAVNRLTPEEPTDWGGGSGFYDAFVEVAPLAVAL